MLKRYSESRRWLAASTLFSFWILPVVVYAQSSPRTRSLSDAIHLQPGLTCLQSTSIIEHTRAWLGSERVDTRLKVEVTGSAEHAQDVSIRVFRGNLAPTVRRFSPGPAVCEQLHAVVGLAIAIAIDAAVFEETGVQPVKPAPLTEPARWSWGVDAYATPKLAQGPGLGAALRLNLTLDTFFDVRLALFGLYGWGGPIAQDVKGNFNASLTACRLDGCAGYQVLKWLRIRGCMGVAAGRLLAWGNGFEKSEASAAVWASVVNALGVQLRITKHFQWIAEAALIAPLRRTVIDVRSFDNNPVAETSLSDPNFLISAGPEFHF